VETAEEDEARGKGACVIDEAEEDQGEDGLLQRDSKQDVDAGHGCVLNAEATG
jgi:hypothetical protein